MDLASITGKARGAGAGEVRGQWRSRGRGAWGCGEQGLAAATILAELSIPAGVRKLARLTQKSRGTPRGRGTFQASDSPSSSPPCLPGSPPCLPGSAPMMHTHSPAGPLSPRQPQAGASVGTGLWGSSTQKLWRRDWKMEPRAQGPPDDLPFLHLVLLTGH